MKITGLRYTQVHGTITEFPHVGEEHHTRPIEAYPGFRDERIWFPLRIPRQDPPYPVSRCYLHIDTDQGVSGTYMMPSPGMAGTIEHLLKPYIIGQNPHAVELIWDMMYREAIHGRKGETMMAMSIVDNCLWDLKGRLMGVPTYMLLGGPTRDAIPVYASMLGYSLEPEDVTARTRELVAQGWSACKWFMDACPADGPEGVRRNVDIVRAAREGAGPDCDLMFDAWNSWDVPYTQRIAELAATFRPRWIEEPVMADMIPQYAELRRTVTTTAIAGGEHEYTRWGARDLLDAYAVDVLQMDPNWAGGLTEMRKIAAMASARGIPLVPHCGGRASLHLIASQTPAVCPIQEWLIQWATVNEHFMLNRLWPENGRLDVPTTPGMGTDLNEETIERKEAIPV